MRNVVWWVAACAVLAACGGANQVDASAAAGRGQARAQALAAAGWNTVASENERFDLPNTQLVRYGAGDAWVYRSLAGTVECSNDFFGGDPLWGVVKHCDVESTTTDTSSSSTASSGWTFVADEWASFTLAGTATVRYGSGSSWVQKTVTDRGNCTNAFFGNDPLFGIVKRCEVQGTVATPSTSSAPASTVTLGWTFAANEGTSFVLSGSRSVRYGVDGAWVQKTLEGTVACTNGFFGDDPRVGVVKRCEVQGDTVVTATAPSSTSTSTSPTPVPSPAPGGARSSAGVFVSGHSLTARPIVEQMAATARSLGGTMAWNQQNIPGSPLRVRTRGMDLSASGFPGYSTGTNRDGSNMDVVSELRNPQTLGGARYDTLVVTERHDLVNTLLWEDTVRYARHFHDRLIAGNPAGTTYLYHSWLDIKDRANPWAWLAYERSVARAWQCVAARVNVTLAATGRGDRMAYLPAGIALADMVELALRGGLPGIGGDASTVIGRLFVDAVHPAPIGEYYLGLVSYASVYRRSPVGAAVPAGVTSEQAAVLQSLAWLSVNGYYASATTPSPDECQALMRNEVCSAFATYTGNPGMASGCVARFAEASDNNPFRYSAGTDAAYWFPAPR